MGRHNKQWHVDEYAKVTGIALSEQDITDMTIADIQARIEEHAAVSDTVENVEPGSGVRLHHARLRNTDIQVTVGDFPYSLPLDNEGNTQSIENGEVVSKLANHPDFSIVEESEAPEPEPAPEEDEQSDENSDENSDETDAPEEEQSDEQSDENSDETDAPEEDSESDASDNSDDSPADEEE